MKIIIDDNNFELVAIFYADECYCYCLDALKGVASDDNVIEINERTISHTFYYDNSNQRDDIVKILMKTK